MIGGTVIETIITGDRVWVNTQERGTSTTCAIYVENTPMARAISEGDIVWWQSGYAYWTAYNRAGKQVGRQDVRLKRIGYSGMERPTLASQVATP